MAGHEARINNALKQLGEEFRLGMVQAEEYRARRRTLIESWGERDATTSPGSQRARAVATAEAPPGAAPTAEHPNSLAPMAIVAGVVVVLAAAGYFVLRPDAEPAAAPGAVLPAAPPPSPQVIAARRAADDFLAGNAWDEEGIARFLEAWRPLGSEDRARAAELPSLVTLRHKLDQNIQAESQLVGPDAPPESRARLTMLEDFARELSGGTP